MPLTLETYQRSQALFQKIRTRRISAEEGYLQILEIDPEEVEALRNLGLLYERKGDLSRASSLYFHLMDRHPYLPDGFELWGALQAKAGNFQEATDYLSLAYTKMDAIWRADSPHIDRYFVDDLTAQIRNVKARYRPQEDSLPCAHLDLHFLLQQLIESKEVLEKVFVNELIASGHDLAPMLAGMIEEPTCPIYAAGNYQAPIHATRLLGELQAPQGIAQLGELLYLDAHPWLRQEAMAALARISQVFPEEVSEKLRAIITDPSGYSARLAALETMGWMGEIPGNPGFLVAQLSTIRTIDRRLRQDFADFCCRALIRCGHEMAATAIETFSEQNRDWVQLAGLTRFASEAERGDFHAGHMLMAESIYDKCCSPKSASELIRFTTVTTLRQMLIQGANLKIHSSGGYVFDEADLAILTRKTGRNDPCPCGSGKKYKQCCGRRT